MILNKANLSEIDNSSKPQPEIFALPEKVLQFGTGVLLRGLPDYFIDKANKQGIFNGRVVLVKSTDTGGADAFASQDGLYTICVRGIENGKAVEENIIAGAISRVLSAKSEWSSVLQCAHNPDMQIVISNTTEVGIQLVEEKIDQAPPVSFPAKLLAFIYERYKAFKGAADKGLVIVPTELIVGNGDTLKQIVLKLAAYNQLEEGFVKWITESNYFCNSLVDRIVPGKPDEGTAGYTDDLVIMCEPYRLWAIQGDEKVKEVLSFHKADNGVIIEPDIEIYRDLKLRLLNGTHTLSCGLAFLSGFTTVKEAMADPGFGSFVRELMLNEIAPAIPANVDPVAAEKFGLQVLDRFSNPAIRHQWISITMQYSSKMKMRVIPVLVKYIETFNKVPDLIAKGFAAYILFTRPVSTEGGKYYGSYKGNPYLINDDKAGWFFEAWKKTPSPTAMSKEVLGSLELWDRDLSGLPGFATAVEEHLEKLSGIL
ncbi:MAG: tagaturonate reductase [Chitinophagaceae bacterium]|nr:tagaturonate reductase [Chitinophagaceae bacterium]MCW5926020.1 tagaturonate reductase [Chitinophagaceae bacterium]